MTKSSEKLRKRILKQKKANSFNLASRYRKEKIFQSFGLGATLLSAFFLVFLLGTILYQGYGAFIYHEIQIATQIPENYQDKSKSLSKRDLKVYQKDLILQSLLNYFSDVKTDSDKKLLAEFIGKRAVRDFDKYVLLKPESMGHKPKIWYGVAGDLDLFLKGKSQKDFSKKQVSWLMTLKEVKKLKRVFNWQFFTNSDSRSAEIAGVLGSLIGSIFLVLICFSVALPLAILTGVYLEEFAKKNKINDLIEISIGNLASVPSIVFGLLGLSIYIGLFNLPRSSTIVGGFTLALMALPTIIVTTRLSLQAVPDSIREAAMGLGASKMQIVFHHTLPMACSGILTGVILSLSRVIGETAPLIMIGMVAFISSVPKTVMDASSAIPVQIYLWADSPEVAFTEKTAGAILILIILLFLINYLAIYLRKKYENRW